MLNIAIYDSGKESAIALRDITKNVMIGFKINFQITTYHSASHSLQKKLSENLYEYDVVILDVHSTGAYEISSMIRKKNLDTAIIFLSNTEQEMQEIFRFRASAYLVKPITEAKLNKVISYIVQDIRNRQYYFTINSKLLAARIPYQYIDCFESQLRNVKVIVNKDKFSDITFITKLDEVYQSLPKENFIRCHQSYIVNLDNVKYLDRVEKKFIMFSGKEIFISKRHYPDVIKDFNAYFKKDLELSKSSSAV
jgi:DNA-binding LytR/AlgR family response regulator